MNTIDKRVLILGANGYIGVALYRYLQERGFNILGVDNEMRERNVINSGSNSLTRNSKPADIKLDISEFKEFNSLKEIIGSFKPETIINLAQQPSAPWSMANSENALETQRNNICGALNVFWAVKEIDPNIHIIQLGTAGEYPDWLYTNIEVPEGSRIEVNYNGKPWTIPTPRYAGSWYHFSKLYNSFNADYASRIWNLRITDINQGVVYGHMYDTRLDYDEYFGTVVNRFVAQAVSGIPLTIYGKKGGQMRGFINLYNSIQAIELMINNSPQVGEYRIIHQLTETYHIREIADIIQSLTNCEIQYIPNPRIEKEENEFVFEAKKLKTLGLQTISLKEELPNLINLIQNHKDQIKTEVILPKHSWK